VRTRATCSLGSPLGCVAEVADGCSVRLIDTYAAVPSCRATDLRRARFLQRQNIYCRSRN
jgi:hypothetical protein